MGARVRRGPTLLGWLAVALSGGAIVAFIAEMAIEVQVLTWTMSLWVSGAVAGLVALLVGLFADRRWVTVRLALLALAIAGGLVALVLLFAGMTR